MEVERQRGNGTAENREDKCETQMMHSELQGAKTQNFTVFLKQDDATRQRRRTVNVRTTVVTVYCKQ